MELLQSLETRLLLSGPTMLFVRNFAWDNDGDGAWRSAVIIMQASANPATDFFVKVYEDDGGPGDDFLYQSPILTASSNSDSYRLPIYPDLSQLPGDDLDGICEFRVKVFSPEGVLLSQFTASDDAAFSSHLFESAAADGPAAGNSPIVSSAEYTGGNSFTPGASKTLTVTTTDSHNPLGAIAWIDVNNDGILNSATEAMYASPLVGLTSTLSAITQTLTRGWPAELSGANYFVRVKSYDGDGNLSTPRVIMINRTGTNAGPVVTSVSATGTGVRLIGSTITFTATASDDTGVSAVSFYVDKDDNALFSPGIDVSLGEDTSSADGWTMTASVASNWGSRVNVRAVARDIQGLSGAAGGPATFVAAASNVAPIVTSLISSPSSVVSWGQSIILTATVTDDNNSIASVMFFFDLDSNNVFSAGDVALGTDTDPSEAWDVWVDVPAWWGAGNAKFVAAATDTNGLVSTSNPIVQLRLNSPPRVTSVTANASVVTFGQTLTLTAAVTDDVNQVRAVTFFFDLDSNMRFSAGDVDLGADSDGTNGWSRSVVVPTWWGAGNAKLVAAAVDQSDQWSTQNAMVQVRLNAPPAVQTNSSSSNHIYWGDTFTLTATVSDPGDTVRAMTFFFDLDSNGRFTPGDVDMGADFNGADGWSITRVLPAFYGAGPAKFVASAVDIADAWSTQTRTASVQLHARPLIGSPSFETNPVARGSSTSLSIISPNPSYVGAVTAFLDVNGDGGWTPGVDRDLGVFTHSAANLWTLLINVTSGNGMANAGAYSIVIDSRDIYGNWVYTRLTIALNVT